MQNRLITFGCSVTYGHALPDCFIPPTDPGPYPSSLAWPSLLSKKLDLKVKNTARCGSSNLEILYKILNFKFSKLDLVVIMWSYPDRDIIFGEKKLFKEQIMKPVGQWQNSTLANHWKQAHSLEDLATRSWFYIHHANLYLDSLGVENYNFFVRYRLVKDYKPKYLNISGYFKTWPQIDYGLDGLHPGIKTHEYMAEKINTYIEDERKHKNNFS